MKTICSGCNQQINEKLCWCGIDIEYHDSSYIEGHSFIPIGCDCYRDEEIKLNRYG